MPYICKRLRTLAASLPILILACAHARALPPSDHREAAAVESLEIDVTRRTASAMHWRSTLEDCSDETYSCLLVPNRMLLAFPRYCRDARAGPLKETRLGQFRAVAPAPHFGFPSGSYMVDSFPRILIFYYENRGVVEVREAKHSPYDADFDAGDFIKKYKIITVDRKPLFLCSKDN